MSYPFVPNPKWYKLDYSSDIYPMSETATTMSIFRLSAEMKSFVDGENLATALKDIMPRFPTFSVMLRKGFFRYYFEYNDNEPPVFPDDGVCMRKIDIQKNNRFLFRVQYYKKRISIDFFHGLCDGTGAVEFLKALVYRYLDECGEDLPEHGDVKIVGEPIPESELEDSISKYYKGFDPFGGVVGKMAGKNCFGIRARHFKTLGYGVIQGNVNVEDLKKLAKEKGCTITALISALALYSIAKVYVKDTENVDLVAMIPINLRKIFPSNTVRNFTTLTKCYVNTGSTPLDLDKYVEICSKDIKEGASNKDELSEKLSVSALLATNKFLKYTPLFLKELGTKIGKLGTKKTKQTLIISNVGIINLPSGMEDYVKRFSFNVNPSRKVPVNIGVASYNGITSITFTRNIVNTEFEREFFTTLVKLGVPVEITSNLRESKHKNLSK